VIFGLQIYHLATLIVWSDFFKMMSVTWGQNLRPNQKQGVVKLPRVLSNLIQMPAYLAQAETNVNFTA
jgi:hypothetical protein